MSHESRIQKILDEYGLNADGTLVQESIEGLTDKEIAEEHQWATECAEIDTRAYEESLAAFQPAQEPKKNVVYTKMGTPCSPQWCEDWIDAVNDVEQEVGHQCCGARIKQIIPCEMRPSSPNGRCRFHGGAMNSGAQKGNTNARIHGLYARRLQQCGGHCPHWNTCPMVDDEVKNIPDNKRPPCAYEVQELDMLRSLDDAAHHPHIPLEDRPLKDLKKERYPVHAQLVSLRENLHMLQIMITRTANAVSITSLTTQTVQQTDTYYASHEKPSALLQAHQMLTREHRRYMALYNTFIKQWGLPKYQSAW